MTISFACPSCAATGSVDASFAGKPARCKHCGHRFSIPRPGEPEPAVYGLEEPDTAVAAGTAIDPSTDSVFFRSQGDGPIAAVRRQPKRTVPGSIARSARSRGAQFAWRPWALRGGVAAGIALAGIALLAPQGTLIVAITLMVLGSAMVLVGYGVGAYAAFGEDFLYGLLYVVVPLYTAYHIVTRWEDLWVWFTCSTVGVVLILLGAELARWGGLGV
jgi:hypothetical protein